MQALPQAMACSRVEPPLATTSRAARMSSASSACGSGPRCDASCALVGAPADGRVLAGADPRYTVVVPPAASARAAAMNWSAASSRARMSGPASRHDQHESAGLQPARDRMRTVLGRVAARENDVEITHGGPAQRSAA